MERNIGPGDSYSVNLPDGQVIENDDPVQNSLIEGLTRASREMPVTLGELGSYIWGDGFNDELKVVLEENLPAASLSLLSKNWQVVSEEVDGEEKFWLEPSPARLSRREPDSPVALFDRIEEGIWNKLSALDKANLIEAFERNRQEMLGQVEGLVTWISDFKKGRVKNVSNVELLDATIGQKGQLAVQRLRSLLSLSILNPGSVQTRSIYGWGKQLNDLILLSGGGEAGLQTLFDAISELSDVERALLLSQISKTKRYEIMMVGLEQVNEREMAFFINSAIYDYNSSHDPEEIEQILDMIVRRDSHAEDFNCSRIIEAFIDHYPKGADFVFRKLIEAARQVDMEHGLMVLFESHEVSARYAKILDEEEPPEEKLPYKRRY